MTWSNQRYAPRGRSVIVLSTFLLALVLFPATESSADSEKEYIAEIRDRMAKQEYGGALDVLNAAWQAYPESLELSKITIELNEKSGADIDIFIEVLNKLIEKYEKKLAALRARVRKYEE